MWTNRNPNPDYLPFLIVWTAERLSLPPTKMRRSSRRDRFRETALDNGGGRNKVRRQLVEDVF